MTDSKDAETEKRAGIRLSFSVTLLLFAKWYDIICTMSENRLPELPIIIVGKDRTRMTCAVIDALLKHIKNANPYFICVSDRSRAGHDKVVESHLNKIGVSNHEVIRTLPEEDRYGWGAAMNLGLSCAFDVCQEATCALMVDNDWILQRDLDIDKYLYAFAFSSIGAITFKHIYFGTNVSLKETTLSDGSTYLLRSKGDEDRYSFTAEIGCMLITRRMYEEYGEFEENCKTDATEWNFCNWYNGMSGELKDQRGLWFATDKDLRHDSLNGEGHVFTHVGIVSQHEGKHQWECPEEYLYLSTDEEDARVCKNILKKDLLTSEASALINGVSSARSRKDTDTTIDWSKYVDKIYVFHHLPQQNRLPRLKEELQRVGILDSGILEMRYTSPTRYNKVLLGEVPSDKVWKNHEWVVSLGMAHLQAFNEALYFGYKRVLCIENDVAFLRDIATIREILDAIPTDCAYVQLDKFINPGFQDYSEYVRQNEINEYFFSPRSLHTGMDCVVLTTRAMQEFCDIFNQSIMPSDFVSERMSCKRAVVKKNVCIQLNYSGSGNLKMGTVDYNDAAYRIQGIDYSEYNVPEGYGYGSILDTDTEKKSKKKKGLKFVSVYAIAKNEASVAARWYECVKEADEVCVLDTGSTDDTVKILRDLGADVTVKTYEDWSFAVARNDSMKLVSPESEILFTLDLDETIAPGWRKKLEDAWIAEEEKGKNPVGAAYKYIWSFYDDGREMQSFAVRKVHKNGVGKWKYRCHELLQEVNGYSFFIEGFVVEHHQNRQTSRSKYLSLLEKDAKEMPEDDRSAYYYARELMYEGRWEEAIEEFKRHLMLSSAWWTCERASSMRNIAYCYRHLKNEDEYELWLWKSAEEDKTNREATYFLGEKAMEKKDYRTAVKVFERCVAIEEPSLEYISMPLVWTARPWFLYAQALWWVNRWNDAVEASKKAMEIEPDNAEVRSQYENMKATRDRYAEGKK